MNTFTKIICHIVFATKNAQLTLSGEDERKRLFRYMAGVIKKKGCYVHCINGVENHIHILLSMHSSVTLADLVKDIKLSSSKMMREKWLFPHFKGWQDGYGAFSVSEEKLEYWINYIKEQENYHIYHSFIEEYKELLKMHNIYFDERYLY